MSNSLFALLLAGAALGNLALPGCAGEKNAVAAEAPQNRCFCVQYTGGVSPYFIGKLSPPSKECAAMKYAVNGKAPWENGLLACAQLRKCLEGSAQYEKKKKILDDKTVQANLHKAECCSGRGAKPGGTPCEAKCVGNWEGILKVLAAAKEKLEQEEKLARETCFSKPWRPEDERKPAAAPVK